MNSGRTFRDFFNAAVHNRLGVAAWFPPGQEILNILVSEQHDIESIDSIPEISSKTGFVFAPFQMDQEHPVLLLRPGRFFRGTEDLHLLPSQPDFPVVNDLKLDYYEASQEEHVQNCSAAISHIQNGDADKVVLSRVKKVTGNKHPAEMLIQMNSDYPGTFCYLFFTPQTGIWLGATPEILLTEEGGIVKTMALAGTRPYNRGSERPWGEKEIQEQHFVTAFIADELRKLGIKHFDISAPYTVKAGSIEHIRTDFVINIREKGIQTGRIVNALHPTPAVCGLPRGQAIKIINNIEKHHRAYYTGFLGTVNMNEQTSLFVNLRCMHWAPGNMIIFAGGGITAGSIPQDEWDETEMKASVMEKVISGKQQKNDFR